MHKRTTIAAVLFAAAVAACAPKDTGTTDTPAPAAPNVVTFTALDFAFEGPAEIPAGPTTFKLVGKGAQLHHMVIAKLEDGKTVDSVIAAMKVPGAIPPWMTFVGGPNAPNPGGEANGTINIEPGNYAILCFVDTPDHVPHFAKGMFRGLTVTAAPAGAAVAAMPTPTSTLTLSDFKFTLDKDLVAGKNVIKVVNTGPQPHEVELIKMEPGKTLEDLGKWLSDMSGPPPGVPVGGVSPFVVGKDTFFEADLTAGEYLLVCFLPDPASKKLHLELGMAQALTIH